VAAVPAANGSPCACGLSSSSSTLQACSAALRCYKALLQGRSEGEPTWQAACASFHCPGCSAARRIVEVGVLMQMMFHADLLDCRARMFLRWAALAA
jgi:predicted metal-binding protein